MSEAEIGNGGCLCGHVRYTAGGSQISHRLCYCEDCQTLAAGNPTALVIFEREKFLLEKGMPTRFEKRGDSGNLIVRSFCPKCGTHLISEPEAKPTIVAVKQGTLDDTSGYKPSVGLFHSRAQPWHSDYGMETLFERSQT